MILCYKCGKLKKEEDFYYRKNGKLKRPCRDCCKEYNGLRWKLYREKHPKKDPFFCNRCGKQKTPEDFYYNKKGPETGKKHGYCKDCVREIHKEQLQKYRSENPKKNPFFCNRCGTLKGPDDFYYNKTGSKALIIMQPCIECQKLKHQAYWDKKSKAKQKHRLMWQKVFLTRDDLSGKAAEILSGKVPEKPKETLRLDDTAILDDNLLLDDTTFLHDEASLGDYRTCPVCGKNKLIGDFWDINKKEHYECADCSNRFHELFDKFVYNAF